MSSGGGLPPSPPTPPPPPPVAAPVAAPQQAISSRLARVVCRGTLTVWLIDSEWFGSGSQELCGGGGETERILGKIGAYASVHVSV